MTQIKMETIGLVSETIEDTEKEAQTEHKEQENKKEMKGALQKEAGECRESEEDTLPECCRKKHRDDKEYRDLVNRLNRIEGQVRGIRKMLEEERYCVDILTQVSAIQSALNSFNKELLSNHIKSCVVHDIQAGDETAVDELCSTIRKLMK